LFLGDASPGEHAGEERNREKRFHTAQDFTSHQCVKGIIKAITPQNTED
jgi:hypothetical protein